MMLSLIDIIENGIDYDSEEAPVLFKQSPYYDFSNATELLEKKANNFYILSLNSQSLNAKFNELKIYLELYANKQINFSAVCIQETWINEHTDLSLFPLQGYHLITGNNSCSVHGGVAIYIRDSFNYKLLPITGNNIT